MATPRCFDRGPEPDVCLLPPGHFGFHKSNHHVWPNAADAPETWAETGRRLQREPMPWLSLKEVEYAMAARATLEEG